MMPSSAPVLLPLLLLLLPSASGFSLSRPPSSGGFSGCLAGPLSRRCVFALRRGQPSSRLCAAEPDLKASTAYAVGSLPALLPPLTDLLSEEAEYRLYSVDMLASCEYLPQELSECVSESCEVYPVDDSSVPSPVKDLDAGEWSFALDGWARWDMPTDDYYDLLEWSEGWTGYDGSEVWSFIHGKIAFPPRTAVRGSWRRDFNDALGGLHSSISAHILLSLPEEGEEGGEDKPTLTAEEVERRLGGEYGRNLDWLFLVLLAAVKELRPHLTSSAEADPRLEELLGMKFWDSGLLDGAAERFRGHGTKDDDTFWKARMRMREVRGWRVGVGVGEGEGEGEGERERAQVATPSTLTPIKTHAHNIYQTANAHHKLRTVLQVPPPRQGFRPRPLHGPPGPPGQGGGRGRRRAGGGA